MPYIQIDACTWVVMREPKDHPVAIIEHVPSVAGVSKYLLRRWHPDPARRPLIGLFGSVEEANRQVKWDNSAALAAASRGQDIRNTRM